MRISGGIYKGRILKATPGLDTRPTPDKVRQAIFNVLMHDIEDAIILDLFAGSGALGIEALSRGADTAVFIEQGREQAKVIRENLNMLDIDARVLQVDHKSGCRILYENNERFDIVFADPPYKLFSPIDIVNLVTEYSLLAENGFLIIEHKSGRSLETEKLRLVRNKKYGQTEVTIYVRSAKTD